MPIARDTGFPDNDAQDDFLRARRGRVLARLSAVLRLHAGDVDVLLSFDEVVEALGRVGEHDLGFQTIALDSIVGTVDRGKEFDRACATAARACARTSSRVERNWWTMWMSDVEMNVWMRGRSASRTARAADSTSGA